MNRKIKNIILIASVFSFLPAVVFSQNDSLRDLLKDKTTTLIKNIKSEKKQKHFEELLKKRDKSDFYSLFKKDTILKNAEFILIIEKYNISDSTYSNTAEFLDTSGGSYYYTVYHPRSYKKRGSVNYTRKKESPNNYIYYSKKLFHTRQKLLDQDNYCKAFYDSLYICPTGPFGCKGDKKACIKQFREGNTKEIANTYCIYSFIDLKRKEILYSVQYPPRRIKYKVQTMSSF